MEKLPRELAQRVEKIFSANPSKYNYKDANLRLEVEKLAGKHWKDLTLESIVRHNTSLGYLSPAGFHFYLPAFIIAVLLHFDAVDVLSDTILSVLTPEEPNKNTGYERRIIEGAIGEFNTDEKMIILEFLKSYIDLFPLSNAALLDFNAVELQRAITYWTNSIG